MAEIMKKGNEMKRVEKKDLNKMEQRRCGELNPSPTVF